MSEQLSFFEDLPQGPSEKAKAGSKKKSGRKKSEPKHDHFGHRNRLKRRFLAYGIDSMEDHEVLEMLLYFAVPAGNTNDVAHRLMKSYGSIADVLEAENADLQETLGVGAHTAVLLNFIPQLAMRFFADRWKDRPIFYNTIDLANYLKALFVGRNKETFFLICLNSKNQVKNTIKLGEGTLGEVVVYPSKVVEATLKQKTRSVIFAHNHPGGNLKASASDVDLTRACAQALHTIDVQVLDHVIVSGDEYYSFAEKGFMQNIRNSVYK